MEQEQNKGEVEGIIEQINDAVEPESVTNIMLAKVLRYLNCSQITLDDWKTESQKKAFIAALVGEMDAQGYRIDITSDDLDVDDKRQELIIGGIRIPFASNTSAGLIDGPAYKKIGETSAALEGWAHRITDHNTAITALQTEMESAKDDLMDVWENIDGLNTHQERIKKLPVVQLTGIVSNINALLDVPPVAGKDNIYYSNQDGGFYWNQHEGTLPSGPYQSLNTVSGGVAMIQDAVFELDGAFYRFRNSDLYRLVDESDLSDAMTQMQMSQAQALSGKLDKSAWDAEHEQFGIENRFVTSGSGNEGSNIGFRSTPFILINRQYPIVADSFTTTGSAAIALYDGNCNFLGAVSDYVNTIGATVSNRTFTLAAEDIPENAVYFRCSSYIQFFPESYYSNGPTQEAREAAVADAVMGSANVAFIKEAEAAGAVYNASTGFFELNGLTDITEPQMRTILRESAGPNYLCDYCHALGRARTFLPIKNSRGNFGNSATRAFSHCNYLEVLDFGDSPYVSISQDTFAACTNLKKIINGKLVTNTQSFLGLIRLEELSLTRLNKDISFKDSPLLSLGSVQFMVNNATNTSPITVTVHPDVYAKLTDESNTEWHAVVTDAAAKQIAFATV